LFSSVCAVPSLESHGSWLVWFRLESERREQLGLRSWDSGNLRKESFRGHSEEIVLKNPSHLTIAPDSYLTGSKMGFLRKKTGSCSPL
jgi:hypothetical protein